MSQNHSDRRYFLKAAAFAGSGFHGHPGILVSGLHFKLSGVLADDLGE